MKKVINWHTTSNSNNFLATNTTKKRLKTNVQEVDDSGELINNPTAALQVARIDGVFVKELINVNYKKESGEYIKYNDEQAVVVYKSKYDSPDIEESGDLNYRRTGMACTGRGPIPKTIWSRK